MLCYHPNTRTEFDMFLKLYFILPVTMVQPVLGCHFQAGCIILSLFMVKGEEGGKGVLCSTERLTQSCFDEKVPKDPYQTPALSTLPSHQLCIIMVRVTLPEASNDTIHTHRLRTPLGERTPWPECARPTRVPPGRGAEVGWVTGTRLLLESPHF